MSKNHAADILVFVVLTILYTLTSSSGFGPLDSPEFVAASQVLGIAHSPGHPIPIFLAKVFSLLPLGEISWRINNFNALVMSLSAVVFRRSCTQLTATLLGKPRAESLGFSVLAALLIFGSWGFWEHAGRAEVYAIQLLLTLMSLKALLSWVDDRHTPSLLWSCFLLGLGFANHHWMSLCFAFPGLILLISLKTYRPLMSQLGMAVLSFLLGLLPLAYLPLRSLRHPLVNFGAPHTLYRFIWTYSGKAFSKSANIENNQADFWSLFELFRACLDSTGVVLACFAIASIAFYKSYSHLSFFICLIASATVTVLGRMLLGFDYSTPDHHAYLMPALCILAMFSVLTLETVRLKAKNWQKFALYTFLVFSVCIRMIQNFEKVNKRHAIAMTRIAEWEFSEPLPRSLILTSYFQTTFRWWSVSALYGLRPDLSVLDRSFMTYPGYPEETALRQPDLKILIDAPIKAGVETPLSVILAMQRSSYIQYHPNLDATAVRSSLPAGAFGALFVPPSFSTRLQYLDQVSSESLESIRDKSAKSEEINVMDTVLWNKVTKLQALCILNQPEWAQRVFTSISDNVEHDPMLISIAQECGLKHQ